MIYYAYDRKPITVLSPSLSTKFNRMSDESVGYTFKLQKIINKCTLRCLDTGWDSI